MSQFKPDSESIEGWVRKGKVTTGGLEDMLDISSGSRHGSNQIFRSNHTYRAMRSAYYNIFSARGMN